MRLFVFLFSLSLGIKAQEIQSIDMGNCWMEKTPMGNKLASFGLKKADLISNEKIEKKIEDLVELEGFSYAVEVTKRLHCGPYGATLLIRLRGEKQACLRMNPFSHEMEVVASDGEKNGDCWGAKRRELIVKMVSEEDWNEASHYLQESYGMESATLIAPLLYRLRFSEEWDFYETQLLQKLQKDSFMGERTRFQELNFLNGFIGESVPFD